VRYIGASSMYAWQFAKMLALQDRHGWARFISMQNHYNLIYREEEREMLPLCRAEGVGVIPWSPLARGFLAGNRRREGSGDTARAKADGYARQLYYQDNDFQIADRVVEVARRLGIKPIQVALAWLVRQPGVTAPIVGVTALEQFDDLVSGLSIALDEESCRMVEEPYRPHPVLGIDDFPLPPPPPAPA
jgi:aryl-alcohol dehydrogenase (NADP+)